MNPDELIEDLLAKAWEQGIEIKKIRVSQAAFDQMVAMARIVSLHPIAITKPALTKPKKLLLNWYGGTVVVKPPKE